MRRRRLGELLVRRPEWEPHETVTIRGLNSLESGHLMDASAGGSLTGTALRYTVALGIVAWTLTDEQGKGLPWPAIYRDGTPGLDHKALQERLDVLAQHILPEDMAYLTGKISELNAPNSKEELESFLASAATSSQEKPSQQTHE